MSVPFLLPDLGAGPQPVRVSSWFFEPGDAVESGERALEVLVSGMTCDIEAPVSGRLEKIERDVDAVVQPGDVVAWIEPARPTPVP